MPQPLIIQSSAPTDSLASAPVVVWRHDVCVEEDAPSSLREAQACHHGIINYATGFAPEVRHEIPGYSTPVIISLLLVFLILCAGGGSYSNFFKAFPGNLFKTRRRGNAFDETTVSESYITAGLLILTCLCEGIIAYFAVPSPLVASFSAGEAIGVFSLAAVGLMMFQTVSYIVTGYAFTSFDSTRQWLKGFFASQSLLGVLMLVPTLTVIFNPALSGLATIITVALYVICRIIFICKGFRIFYINIFSGVYFILYLCTLEITPLLLMQRIFMN